MSLPAFVSGHLGNALYGAVLGKDLWRSLAMTLIVLTSRRLMLRSKTKSSLGSSLSAVAGPELRGQSRARPHSDPVQMGRAVSNSNVAEPHL